MMQRHLNTSFWLATVAYAIAAATIFLAVSVAGPSFTNMDDCFPVPIRVVMYVGRLGWLALVLAAGVATLCAPDSWWRAVSVILICLLASAIMCTIIFTNIEHPSHIFRSNIPAAGKAGFALWFAIVHPRPGLPEPGR